MTTPHASHRPTPQSCWHEVQTVYMGLSMSHDPRSVIPIKWRLLELDIQNLPWEESARVLDNFPRNTGAIADFYMRTGEYPENLSDILNSKGECSSANVGSQRLLNLSSLQVTSGEG
jgi:hypothetical protein